LQKLAAEMSTQYARRFIGKVLPVLLETSKNGQGEGHSGNYLKVTVAVADETMIGTIQNVLITDITKDGILGNLQK